MEGSGRFSRIGRDIHDPLIVCPWGRVWGGVFGLLSPGLDQAGCQTWPNLKLGFGGEAPFFSFFSFFLLRGDKRPYLLLYGRELRGRCVIRGWNLGRIEKSRNGDSPVSDRFETIFWIFQFET